MSTSLNNKAAEKNISKKMSAVKEKSTTFRYRHKRPDKQLYVPRALRKTDIENAEMKDDNTSTINKAAVKCFQNTYVIPKIEKSEINLSLQRQNHNDAEDSKVNNLEVDDTLNVEQTGVSLLQTSKDSEFKRAVNCVSGEHSKMALNSHELCITDNENHFIVKLNIDLEGAVKSSKKANISKNKINTETTDNVNSIKINNEAANFSNEDLCKKINVVQVKVQEDCPSSENPEDSWETMFNDDGDCLDPKFIKELCDITGQIDLAVAKCDYSNYQPVCKNSAEEFQNIVELYGFPVEFSTQDLTSAFSSFQEASYNIKWVDDCHALAIFSSPAIASEALHLSHPFIKVRPVSEGIKESKEKARFCARMFDVHKPRPVTSAVLARRLVSGALGLKVKASKEQRDIERNILREAKEKKKLKARQRQDIWNGIVS